MSKTVLNCIVSFCSDVSKKTGNPYTFLNIEFDNGYSKRVFLDNAESYMLEQIMANLK